MREEGPKRLLQKLVLDASGVNIKKVLISRMMEGGKEGAYRECSTFAIFGLYIEILYHLYTYFEFPTVFEAQFPNKI